MPEPLLQVDGLVQHYPVRSGFPVSRTVGHVQAVDGVSFTLDRGETLGLVGESGCGKSTVARVLLGLERATAGRVLFDGQDVLSLRPRELRQLRRRMQIVFQDPYTSLNPRMTVGDIVAEPWDVHRDVVPRGGRRRAAQDLLARVGLNPDALDRYPHQFSGGQRQRIGIARALALNPEVVVCDEPVSALDVSVQAQVVTLLEDLQADLGIAYLFIAHDLAVVRHISTRVAVMYLGRVVEVGDEHDVYERPTHPYTQALLSAAPSYDVGVTGRAGATGRAGGTGGTGGRRRILLEGDVPDPADPPSGCRFRTRCWKAQDVCAVEDPALVDRYGHGHPSACHFAEVDTSWTPWTADGA